MPSFSEHFSGVSLSGRRLMGLDAGVQLFGHFLNSCCHMWPLLWTGELQARIAFLFLSELYRASPLTHTRQAPRTGCQLLDFHLWGFIRFPLTDTSRRKRRITLHCQPQFSVLTLINVCLPVCYPTLLAAALSLSHWSVLRTTFLTSNTFSVLCCCVPLHWCSIYYKKIKCQSDAEMHEVWVTFQLLLARNHPIKQKGIVWFECKVNNHSS